MKKILLVDGTFPINTRSSRIVDTLIEEYEIKYCAWDRMSVSTSEEKKKNYILSGSEGYGKKIKKLCGLLKFYNFFKKTCKEFLPEYIIASHWDMLILSFLLKNKNQKLIYDDIDMPTSKNRLVLFFLKKIELIALKRTDGVIFASRFYSKCYEKKKYIILENKPSKEIYNNQLYNFKSEKIKVCFIGTIRYYSLFEQVIKKLKKYENKIEFLFFGSGHIEKKLKELVLKNNQKNIYFFGKYSYEDIARFYNLADLIWAVYPEEYNVKYAISNKFHESIVFEKPCIFSKNTLLGEFVEINNIGISVEIKDIDIFFQDIINDKIDLIKIKKTIKEYKIRNQNIYWEDDEKILKKFIKEIL